MDGVLAMEQLHYANEIRSAKDVPVPDVTVKPAELTLAQQLIEQSATDEFHPEQFHDQVRDRILAAIQQKVDGQEITAEPQEAPQAKIIDLMEALKASLAKKGSGGSEERKPAKRATAKAASRSRPQAEESVEAVASRKLTARLMLHMKSYTTRDVARLLGLSPAQVRGQARAGFLVPDRGPRNTYRFSFQDLVLLRTAKALADARIPGRRIHRALQAAGSTAPPRAELERGPDYRRRRPGGGARRAGGLEPGIGTAGAGLLGGRAGNPRRADRTAGRARRTEGHVPLDAAEWFELGNDLEAVAPAQACEAYERALAARAAPRRRTGESRAAATGGRRGARGRRDSTWLRSRPIPPHPTAAFNLGTALEDLGRPGDAIAAYERALEAEAGVCRCALQSGVALREGGTQAGCGEAPEGV